jgi:hypothetical protein
MSFVLSDENYAQPNRIAVILEIPFLKKLIYFKKKKKTNNLNYNWCAIKIEKSLPKMEKGTRMRH